MFPILLHRLVPAVSDSFDCIFQKIYYHHICFLSFKFSSFQKLSISDVSSSRFLNISSSLQFHHSSFSKNSIFSSLKRFLINLAGFPPYIVYGSTLFTTVELAAIIAPSPITTPGIMVTFRPIQTSLPITVSPLNGSSSIVGATFSHPPPKILNG